MQLLPQAPHSPEHLQRRRRGIIVLLPPSHSCKSDGAPNSGRAFVRESFGHLDVTDWSTLLLKDAV